MEQCVKIAVGIADRAILAREEERRAGQWHRRLLAWWVSISRIGDGEKAT
jgi:hypothetical protein